MSQLETWVAAPLAGAVGWTLLHSLWEGALIAAALAATLAVARSPRARYAAACFAMLLLMAGFGFTLMRMLPPAVSGFRIAAVPIPPAWHDPADSAFPHSAGTRWKAMVPWMAPVWMAGVAILYSWHVAGWLGIWRLRRRGVCIAAPRWRDTVARLSERLRVVRPVMLLESCLTQVPVVVGHFRPMILIPVGLLAGWPTQQIEAILLHELAHIRRYDYLVNVWQRLVEGLLFYHPAVWWISRAIRTEREICCDDVVVDMTGDAQEYAATLAALEETRSHRREPALAATGGSLVKRIHRLLYPKASNSTGIPVLAAVVLVVISAAVLAAWQAEPTRQSSSALLAGTQNAPPSTPRVAPTPAPPQVFYASPNRAATPAAGASLEPQAAPPPGAGNLTEMLARLQADVKRVPQAHAETSAPQRPILIAQAQQQKADQLGRDPDTPYRKWLNEDVAYIISDAERAAFKNLSDDSEREHFIQQFWERRNPTPGRADNPYKEEHYRRIAYTNTNYSTPRGLPGWKTDMGRIYIQYGPPDELEVHPSGTPQTPPFQDWKYKFIEEIGRDVIVRFVDRDRTGDYLLTTAAPIR